MDATFHICFGCICDNHSSSRDSIVAAHHGRSVDSMHELDQHYTATSCKDHDEQRLRRPSDRLVANRSEGGERILKRAARIEHQLTFCSAQTLTDEAAAFDYHYKSAQTELKLESRILFLHKQNAYNNKPVRIDPIRRITSHDFQYVRPKKACLIHIVLHGSVEPERNCTFSIQILVNCS